MKLNKRFLYTKGRFNKNYDYLSNSSSMSDSAKPQLNYCNKMLTFLQTLDNVQVYGTPRCANALYSA
jgi:hypothetical protein